MASIEHLCIDCGHLWFNNALDSACPKCGSIDVDSESDEGRDGE